MKSPLQNKNSPVDQQTLDTMRRLLADRLVEQLKDPEVPPGVMQAALRFLNDYDEEGLPITGSGLMESPPFKET